jgi:nitrite reductase (NAD(P)H)
MHKRNFSLTSGACLNDNNYSIITFDVKVDGDNISVLLPEMQDLDTVIATERWMVKRDTAQVLDGDARLKASSTIEILSPKDEVNGGGCVSACGDKKLEW